MRGKRLTAYSCSWGLVLALRCLAFVSSLAIGEFLLRLLLLEILVLVFVGICEDRGLTVWFCGLTGRVGFALLAGFDWVGFAVVAVIAQFSNPGRRRLSVPTAVPCGRSVTVVVFGGPFGSIAEAMSIIGILRFIFILPVVEVLSFFFLALVLVCGSGN